MSGPVRISDQQFQELAIAHLLRELDVPGETTFAVELMRRGEPGHAMLRDIQETLGELALAVAPAEPSPAVRARVLSGIGLPPQGAEALPRHRRSRQRLAAVAALAGLLAALGAGIWVARVVTERERLRGQIVGLERRIAATDTFTSRLAELREDVGLVGSPSASVRTLASIEGVEGAGARVFVDRASGRAVLLVTGLPALGPDEVYALWSIGPDGAHAAGAFQPDSRGYARLEIGDLELLPEDRILAVSAERAPVGSGPTGDLILSSDATGG